MQQTRNLLRSSTGSSTPARVGPIPPLVVAPEHVTQVAPVEPIGQPKPDADKVRQLETLTASLARSHRAAAEAWLAEGCQYEATRHLEAAVVFAPDVLEYHNQLGYLRYLAGDDTAAIAAFERVLAGEEDNADAHFNLGMVLYGNEDFERAERHFGRALEVGAPDPEVWNNRGVCCFQLQRIEDARTCFSNALSIDPDNADARVNLADLADLGKDA